MSARGMSFSIGVRSVEPTSSASHMLPPPVKPNLWLGWMLALGSTIAFSTGPTIVKFAQNLALNTNQILAARFVLSTLVLGGIGLATPGRLRLTRVIALTAFGIGLVNGVSMLAF